MPIPVSFHHSGKRLGADCVSGGEVQAALDAGFPADKIVFAGVGKADWEINLGLDNDIFCFNVESAVELEIINELAATKNKVASIALRINRKWMPIHMPRSRRV